MPGLLQDLRWAGRRLVRDRGFSALAVLVLAVALGLSSTVFSLIEAVFLRPSPFPSPESLVLLWGRDEQRRLHAMAPYDFMALGDQPQILAGIAGVVAGSEVGFTLSGQGEPERVSGALVTGGFFRVLGVGAALGRTLTPQEGQGSGPRVAILSHRLWKRRFNGDPAVVGGPVTLSRSSYTVVGIMPAGFDFPEGTDVWIADPFHATEALDLGLPTSYSLTVVARLAAGTDIARARKALASVSGTLKSQGSEIGDLAVIPLQEERVSGVRPLLITLTGAVSFLLLIAVTNLANLLLVRRRALGRDFAVRAVIGAERHRLVRLAAAEGLLLSFCGAVFGVLLSVGAVRLLVAFAPAELARFAPSGAHPVVLGFMILISLAVGGLLSLGPAVDALRLSLRRELGETPAGGRRGGTRLHGALVAVETGLTLVLLAGAGLMATTLFHLTRTELGFDPEGLLTLKLTLSGRKYPAPEQRMELYGRLLERLRALPGVEQAGGIDSLPVLGGGFETLFFVDGVPPPHPGEEPVARCAAVMGGYFPAMRIHLVRGRLLQASDGRGGVPVALVDEAFARRFLRGQDPLGRRLSVQGRWRLVVGVVRRVREQGVAGPWEPQIYLPYEQAPFAWPFFYLVARTRADPDSLVSAVRGVVWAEDKDQPLENIRSYRWILAESIARQRVAMLLIGTFAALSLLLSVIGLYGVVAYSAAQRKQEIGIRIALGARPADVVRLVLGPALRYAAAGMVAGLALTFGLTWLLESLLYGVSPTDPWHFAGASLLMGAVAAVASFLPAWRAAKLDPLHAMRL